MTDKIGGNLREDVFLQSEQRRYQRLEVSLPVWLAVEDEIDRKTSPWSLGYTRDISLGGAKVVVPHGEQARWREVAHNDQACVLRFDTPDEPGTEFIYGHVRRAVHDTDAGIFWLGIEYSEGAQEAKTTALRAAFATVRSRRLWQWAFVVALLAIVVGGFFIRDMRVEAQQMQQRLSQLEQERAALNTQISALSGASVVETRAQGMDAAFQREVLEERVEELTQNIQRLSQPENQRAGEREREAIRQREGIELSDAPLSGVQVNFGLALPYGYAWPQVVTDVEQLMGRKIPTVVVFRDFKSEFPIVDCREARARAKTLQITWEPWHFENPQAIKLQDIIAGRHDKYIDSWADAAKSFGSEVWIRWGHEFNGNWYPWSIAANDKNPQLYAQAFRHVRDRFSKAGAFNARWIWCVNAESVPQADWNDPRKAYPGDDYVDMIAIDGYNFGNTLSHSRWQSFEEIYARPYDMLTKEYPNKPIMIGEVASATAGGDKAAWIAEMDKALRSRFGRVQGVVWFEAQKEADWRMTSSPTVLRASRTAWNRDYYRRGEP